MSPAEYDPKHGSPPEVPYLYCQQHGFFSLAGLTEAEFAEIFNAHAGHGPA